LVVFCTFGTQPKQLRYYKQLLSLQDLFYRVSIAHRCDVLMGNAHPTMTMDARLAVGEITTKGEPEKIFRNCGVILLC
jgi:hypothetical protein